MSPLSVILLTSAAIAAAVGQILFRVGARGRTEVLALLNWQIILGFVLYGTATLVWVYVLSREQLVKVYAFTGLRFVLVYLGAVFFLGETLHLRSAGGVALVMGGLYLVARG